MADIVEGGSRRRRPARATSFDPIDAQALRSQVKARLSLVEEGDYFSLLGVPRSATSYEIHRAYLELRHGFEPGRVLNAATADLADDIELIMDVLDEAHDILRDQARRERYKRAIEDKPPA
jgi:curved DNA-binding protein CbpA